MYVKICTLHGDTKDWRKAPETEEPPKSIVPIKRISGLARGIDKKYAKHYVDSGSLIHTFEVDEVRSQFHTLSNISEFNKFRGERYYEKVVGWAPKDVAFQVVELQMERDGKKFSCLVQGEATIYLMNKHGDTIDKIYVQEYRGYHALA